MSESVLRSLRGGGGRLMRTSNTAPMTGAGPPAGRAAEANLTPVISWRASWPVMKLNSALEDGAGKRGKEKARGERGEGEWRESRKKRKAKSE